MERRDWSIKALNELVFVDSLDDDQRADGLVRWNEKYLKEGIEVFDLELKDLETLHELFYKNISFLKEKKEKTRVLLAQTRKVKKFFR